MLRDLAFRSTRAVGGRLPLGVVIAALWPVAFLRAVAEAIRYPSRRPPHRLVPPRRSGWPLTGIGRRTAAWLNTGALLWADQFGTARWAGRIDMSGLEQIRALTADRPVILVSLHFGGIAALPALMRAHGVPTASVVGGKLWPIRWWRRRRAELTQIDGLPTHFQAGDAWSIKRYLTAGRCVLVAIDYPQGEQVRTDFEGSTLQLSTPPFRLARLSGSAVVPIVVRADGVWRFEMRVGRPVPDAIIQAGDYPAAVAHVVGELLPIAAGRPDQAMPLLVRSFVDSVHT